MKISFINPIYTSSLKNNVSSKMHMRSLSSDVFVRNTSFSGNRNDYNSYDKFSKWANDTDFLDKVDDIVSYKAKILGSGFEGITYEIPNTDKWIIKRFKRGDFIPNALESSKYTQITDISPKLNIGQSIARVETPAGPKYSNVYYVLKKQSGNSIGVAYSDSCNVCDLYTNSHIKSLKLLADSPQSTFDKCIENIDYVNSLGYEFDCSNPHNFMYDVKSKQINFVDINDLKQNENNQFGEVLYALLDGNYGIEFSKSDSDIKKKNEVEMLSSEIIKKFFNAMKKHNFKFENGIFFNILLNSTILDNVLGTSVLSDKMHILEQSDLM